MSSDQSSGPKSSIPGKKLSLKELAEKAKNTPAPPPVSTPAPARASAPSVPPIPAPAAVPSVAPPPSVPPPSAAPAASAEPAPAPVVSLEEARGKKGKEKKKKAAAAAAAPVAASPAKPAPAEKEGGGGSGAAIGILLALGGIAAGGFFYFKNQSPAPAPAAEAKQTAAPAATSAAPKQEVAVAATVVPEKKDDAVNLDAIPSASADAPAASAVAQAGSGAGPAKSVEVAVNDPKFNPEIKMNGTLDQAIEKVAGGPGQKHADDAAPAAAKDRNQTIPEKPSQGKVAAAVGGVMGGAKACVAGAEDVSKATITFGSSGKATNVSVSGWAASHGQSGCVKSALMGANVGPFSDSTFTFSVTIRP